MEELDVIKHFFQRLGEHPTMKVIAGFFLWLTGALFGQEFRAAYGAVAILFVLDFITGYSYAWMSPEIKPSSRRMFHGAMKLLIYILLLMVGYQVSSVTFGALIQSVIESFVVLTEAKSVLENIKKIADLKGVELPFLDSLVKIVEGKIEKNGGGG